MNRMVDVTPVEMEAAMAGLLPSALDLACRHALARDVHPVSAVMYLLDGMAGALAGLDCAAAADLLEATAQHLREGAGLADSGAVRARLAAMRRIARAAQLASAPIGGRA